MHTHSCCSRRLSARASTFSCVYAMYFFHSPRSVARTSSRSLTISVNSPMVQWSTSRVASLPKKTLRIGEQRENLCKVPPEKPACLTPRACDRLPCRHLPLGVPCVLSDFRRSSTRSLPAASLARGGARCVHMSQVARSPDRSHHGVINRGGSESCTTQPRTYN